MTIAKRNLLAFNRQGLFDWLGPEGFTAPQVARLIQAIHQFGETAFDQLVEFSKPRRQWLQQYATLTPLAIKEQQFATDGVIKWLFLLDDGNAIETVYIPEAKRATLCISSQVGCSLNCSFCATARQGFNRNLTTAEIIGQVYTAARQLASMPGVARSAISNVVFMGMGEPLLNLDSVLSATDLFLDDFAYGLAKRRVTISTSGVVPAMRTLRQQSDTALAVSLHAPTDELRDILVPLNKKYPLDQLMTVCRDYYPGGKREITFEYVMLAGINDQPEHAKALIELLAGIPAKINLIPFNPFPKAEFTTSAPEVITGFLHQLVAGGIVTTIRKTRGQNIAAACGQLAGNVSSRADRQHHIANKLRKIPIIQQQQSVAVYQQERVGE